MKILIVTNMFPIENYSFYGIFVKEQYEALKNKYPDDSYEIYFINPLKSKLEYLHGATNLYKKIRLKKYDIIHAHYGYTGFISAFVKNKTPLVTTFHGSDINSNFIRVFSKICEKRNNHSIIVSEKMLNKMRWSKVPSIIPCGVNTDIFYPIHKEKARNILGVDRDKILIIFPARPQNKRKNFPLFQLAISNLKYDIKKNLQIKYFDNLSRDEINLWNNAADMMILTSLQEGSPTVVKEAMACNLPIISVDVGDVKTMLHNVKYSIITDYTSHNISKAIEKLVSVNDRSNGREILFSLGLDNDSIVTKIHDIYRYIS